MFKFGTPMGKSMFSTASSEEERSRAYDLIQQYTNEDVGVVGIVQSYNETSEEYDKNLEVARYDGPLHTSNVMADLYPDSREHIKVLDVAAGTGLVAFELSKRGFKDMDALDPAEGMLQEAKKKRLYGRLICAYIDGSRLQIEDGDPALHQTMNQAAVI